MHMPRSAVAVLSAAGQIQVLKSNPRDLHPLWR